MAASALPIDVASGTVSSSSTTTEDASSLPSNSTKRDTKATTSYSSTADLFDKANSGDVEARKVLRLDNADTEGEDCALVNEYIFLQSLGHGSFGFVRRALKVGSGGTIEQYAVKHFSKKRLLSKKIFRRIGPMIRKNTMLDSVKRELAIMKKLHHPGVIGLVEAIDPGEDDLYLILEYASLGTLVEYSEAENKFNLSAQWLPLTNGRNVFSEEEMLPIASQLLAGLEYMHSKGVVHRDIKPENILGMPLDSGEYSLQLKDSKYPIDISSLLGGNVSEGSRYGSKNKMKEVRVCLADLGCALLLEKKDDDFLSSSSGSPVFRAPECCTGEKYSAMKADVWALGCTFFIFLTGEHPIEEASTIIPEIQLNSILARGASNVKGKLQGYSLDFQDFIGQCLRTNPEERPWVSDLRQHKWVTSEPRTALGTETCKPLSAPIKVTSGDLEAALSPLKKLKNLVSTSIKLKRALKRSLSKGLLEGRLTEKSGALSKALSERLLISTKEGNEGEEEGEK